MMCYVYVYKCVHTHTHKMECYAAKKKKNEIMLFAAMWVNLGFIMLSEVSETEEQYHDVTCG